LAIFGTGNEILGNIWLLLQI